MTITGTFLTAAGVARASTVITFTPESNPQADSSGILTAVDVTATTDAAGAISVTLDQGIYLVQVGKAAKDKFRIRVEDGSGTADITDLIVTSPLGGMTYVAGWFIPAYGNNYQFQDSCFQVKNYTTNLFHKLWVVGEVGAEQLQIETPGNIAVIVTGHLPARGNNYRLKDGYLQIYNQTTELYYPLWAVGAEGSEEAGLGAGEA